MGPMLFLGGQEKNVGRDVHFLHTMTAGSTMAVLRCVAPPGVSSGNGTQGRIEETNHTRRPTSPSESS